jgi:hypothetical protein
MDTFKLYILAFIFTIIIFIGILLYIKLKNSDKKCSGSCTGKECGTDGCNNSCGKCDNGKSCINSKCVCTGSCTGKECGTDGCNNSCGKCDNGKYCSASKCLPIPILESYINANGKDRLEYGEYIKKGDSLKSSGGNMLFQDDGNICITTPQNRLCLNGCDLSSTTLREYLRFDEKTGKLGFYDINHILLPSDSTCKFYNPATELIMQSDGNLGLYNGSPANPVWDMEHC